MKGWARSLHRPTYLLTLSFFPCSLFPSVIPEVLKLIERELKLDISPDRLDDLSTAVPSKIDNPALLANLPVHVAAWLTVNSMRMEQLQFFQLSLQNLHTVWRKKAFSDLLADSSMASSPQLVSFCGG